jgi:WD40 repeat protein
MSFSSVAVGSILATRKKGTGPVSGEGGRPNDALRQHVQAGQDAYAAGRDLTINQYGQEPPARRGQPEVDSWVAAIYLSAQGGSPVGSGVVIDRQRVLTCAHVVMKDGVTRDAIWVAFPMTDPPIALRCRVASVITPGDGGFDEDQDVAILELTGATPTGVTPARLRCPTPKSLVGQKWWAFGFPPRQRRGSASEGDIGAALTAGWVRIDVTSAYPIEPGFSGTGLWSPEFDAVVGIVAVYDEHRNGQALTIHQAAQCLPDQGLRELTEESRATDSGEVALTAWGWTLATDPEGRRHWRPRARGVSIDSERGYRFRGRTAALTGIKDWLDRPAPDRKVLVVTGNPGAGKSAVLGRIVTTADPDAARQLPADDAAVRATEGSVACAVHAKGLTALEIATKIAIAASAELPERIEDFPPALRDALTERAGRRFNVLIDALDESTEPRTVIAKVVLPVAETCYDVGAQMTVGSRRTDENGDLIAALGGATKLVDLDTPRYIAEGDLAAYALATLQLSGDPRAGNPYNQDDRADPLAKRIARLSHPNFLVAGLTARTHGLYDDVAVDPGELSFSPRVDDAMREYLRRIPDVGDVSAEALLLPLAHAESPGLPVSLWRVGVRALGFGDVPERDLAKFARSTAASFLVESAGSDGNGAVYRLFHQALNDALRHSRAAFGSDREDDNALAIAFLAAGREMGWDRAPAYLLRSLQAHAARAGLIDSLLADDAYLLHADLLRLQPLADQSVSVPGHQRARLLRLAPRELIAADPPSRAAILSLTETLEDLGDSYTRTGFSAPYQAGWVDAQVSAEHSALRGHWSLVLAVAAFTLDGAVLLATGGIDATVRIWDPATGTQLRTLTGHADVINAIAAFSLDGEPRLATGSDDRSIIIWDPATGTQLRVLTQPSFIRSVAAFALDGIVHLAACDADGIVRIWNPATGTHLRTLTEDRSQVNAICTFTRHDTTFLATGSSDGTIRIWDPASGICLHTLTEDQGSVNAICTFSHHGTTFLAADGSEEGTLQIWNLATGTRLHTLTGHQARVSAVTAFTHHGTTLLAAGSEDGTVEIWDPVSGTQQSLLACNDPVYAICAFTRQGRTFLAAGDGDGTVRVWDPQPGALQAQASHVGHVSAVALFPADGTTHLASTGGDGMIRIRDPATGTLLRTLTGHHDRVNAVTAFALNGTTHLATGSGKFAFASDDCTVRIWNPATGAHVHALTGHVSMVTSVAAFVLDGRPRLATASYDRTVRIWDLATGTHLRVLADYGKPVHAVCAFTRNGTPLLAVGEDSVQVWDPATGSCLSTLAGHDGPVTAVIGFTLNGATRLASGGSDGTIRIWDLATGAQLRVLTGHNLEVRSVCAFTLNGTTILASAGGDRTVRLWNPANGASVLTIPTRDEPWSVAYSDGLLFVGTSTGLVAIRLNMSFLMRALL